MIRNLKVAKDVAVKARTSAMITLRHVLVYALTELREELQPLTKMALIRRSASLRPGTVDAITAAGMHTLRSMAQRWLALNEEITEHERIIGDPTEQMGSGQCCYATLNRELQLV